MKSFRRLEGELAIDASHDGLGTVQCSFTVGQPWPPVWSCSASLDFGAGANLDEVASQVEKLFQ